MLATAVVGARLLATVGSKLPPTTGSWLLWERACSRQLAASCLLQRKVGFVGASLLATLQGRSAFSAFNMAASLPNERPFNGPLWQ